METDIKYGTCELDDGWHVKINNIAIRPSFRHEDVAKVFLKCLRAGALQDLFEIKETLLDKVFKDRNAGR